ncbi:MAG: hypothetical protein RJB65_1144 [Actinomycetota bacterium]
MTHDGRNATAGALWAMGCAVAYSLSSVVGKDLLGSLGAESMLFWRFGIAAVLLWVFLFVRHGRGGPDPLAVPHLRSLALGMLFAVMVYIGFRSLEYLDVSVYIVIVYVYPVLVVVGSSLLGHHKASPLIWLSLAVVMVGVVLTVPELFGGVGEISGLGVGIVIVQAFLMAAFMIVSGRVLPPTDGVVQAGWNVLGGTVAMAPLAFGGGLVVPTGGTLVAEVLLFALVPTLLSNVAFYRAMRHIAPGIVAMVMTAEVALAILWSIIFLGEEVRGIKLLGAAVVIAGVLLAQWVIVRESPTSAEVSPPAV